jgi:hypothetical protein
MVAGGIEIAGLTLGIIATVLAVGLLIYVLFRNGGCCSHGLPMTYGMSMPLANPIKNKIGSFTLMKAPAPVTV